MHIAPVTAFTEGAYRANLEQQAFLERAIEQYGKATYNFAYRLTRSDADASDLTQEAFIRVFRAWQRFTPGSSFRSWIYRIVTNLYHDELRRRKVRFCPERFSDRTVSPIEEYVEAYLSEPVSKALAGLTPGQRSIVLLADVQGCRYQEIGRILGCSISTVRSRLHRARRAFRTLYNPRCT